MDFIASRWLRNGHAQTLWAALAARSHYGPRPRFWRQRWSTPDGDFVDADWLRPEAGQSSAAAPVAGLLVLFHGLEGSSASHYALAFADWAREHRLMLVVPHFRGCGGEINRAPRAYHSGDHAEIGWMLAQARARWLQMAQPACASAPVYAVGVSLGGNALLRWAGECGGSARWQVDAIASICAPLDLHAGGTALGRGINRWLYTPVFLRTMKPKAMRKLAQYPGLFDAARLAAARDLYAFDDVFTAPLHGFAGTSDYWTRASAKPHLPHIAVPALVVNAKDDPFVPAASLPAPGQAGPNVTLWQPPVGGHVGFVQGRWPGHVRALPDAVGAWLLRQAPGKAQPYLAGSSAPDCCNWLCCSDTSNSRTLLA